MKWAAWVGVMLMAGVAQAGGPGVPDLPSDAVVAEQPAAPDVDVVKPDRAADHDRHDTPRGAVEGTMRRVMVGDKGFEPLTSSM